MCMLQKNGQAKKCLFLNLLQLPHRCVLGEVQGLCNNPRKSVQIMGLK